MTTLRSRSVLSFMLSAVACVAAATPKEFQRPLVFEPNHGQAPAPVKWIARTANYRLALSNEGITIVLPKTAAEAPTLQRLPLLLNLREAHASIWKPAHAAVQMKLTGGRPWTNVAGMEPTGGISNYFIGRDPKTWRTNIPQFARLSAKEVYDGIDLVLYSRRGELEYDFIVAPGADPKQVRLAFDGVEHMRVDRQSGDLVLTASNGAELRHVRPKVYQQVAQRRVEIAGAYEILDRRQATFALASYDRRRPLVIDPTIRMTTFLRGSYLDSAIALAADSSGAYVTGETDSPDFPVSGAIQTNQPATDAFVTKLSPSGAIIFSTYLGGSGNEIGWGIAVDSTGVFVTGDTVSGDFPMQHSLFPNRSRDAFVTKIAPGGNSLIYSGYLGGSGNDFASGIAVDATHAAWVVGTTNSRDFPILGGPSAGQQRQLSGTSDAYLARIAPDGLSVTFSTFVGGPNGENGMDVAVDRTGSVYATGSTGGGLPITAGMSPCPSITGGNAFVVRRRGPGTQAIYSTCLGPGVGSGIAVDANFNAYIVGSANDNFPTTAGAFQRTKPNTSGISAFVTKLGSTGAVVYATYLGGSSGSTSGYDVALGRGGTVYVSGLTSSTDFPGVAPLVPNPTAGFVSQLTAQGNGLNHTTRLGAAVHSVAFVPSPVRYLGSQIYTSGYRYTFGTSMQNLDAFVVRLEENDAVIFW